MSETTVHVCKKQQLEASKSDLALEDSQRDVPALGIVVHQQFTTFDKKSEVDAARLQALRDKVPVLVNSTKGLGYRHKRAARKTSMSIGESSTVCGADSSWQHLTGLHEATYEGNEEQFHHLLRSTDVNTVTSEGVTALHVAAWTGRLDFASELIRAGSHVNLKNNLGQTPLHLAATMGKTELVQLLLTSAADRRVRDLQGKQARDLAVRREIQELLSPPSRVSKLLASAACLRPRLTAT